MSRIGRSVDADAVCDEIDRLWGLLFHCHSVFPPITDDVLEQQEYATASFYLQNGNPAQIRFGPLATPGLVQQGRQIGKWINENALIRLYGLLNYHGFFLEGQRLAQPLQGWREMDLLRRMRNAFMKTPLGYRPEDREIVRLRSEVITYFDVPECHIVEGDIPTPIDGVLEPIFRGCREYVYQHEATEEQAIERKPKTAMPT